MAHTILFLRFSKGHNSEGKKGGQSILCGTLCLDLIYISIKYYEDILKIFYGRTAPCHNRTAFFSKRAYKNQKIGAI